jgi:AcrR family transcriptional regulator
MATDTRQRLITAAKQRFYRDGFRNVGIDAILTDVGVSKAAFYKHFESKDALMVAVLADVDGFLQRQFREMVKERGGRSAQGQLGAVLDVVQHVIEDKNFHGCIFVNAAMEFPLPHDPAHQASLKHKRAIEEFIYELAERAAVDRPAELAQELCLIIEGAYVTRSVTGDPSSIAIARRLADRIIAEYVRRVG